mgnify:CR=1 FL=1
MMNNTTYGTFLNEKKFQSLSKEIFPLQCVTCCPWSKKYPSLINIELNAKCFVPDWFMARSPDIIDAIVCKILILFVAYRQCIINVPVLLAVSESARSDSLVAENVFFFIFCM